VARPKAAINCKISPWLSAKTDSKEKRFLQIGNSLLLSEEMKGLGNGARYLYLCMAMEAGGKRDFAFPAAAAKKYGIARNSFDRFKAELIAAGLICLKESGWTTREKNIYEFRIDWKARSP
jgi:hypothetical protein